jgi:hypothetical protein
MTSGEMANCDWLRRNFAGLLFSSLQTTEKIKMAANENRFHANTFYEIKKKDTVWS